ncbi:MAG TPA: hypothetical protein VFR06_05365 [Gallionellaceae bacterium]|nr:hypothetical protein [Gallionellaceae bacterium]
MLKVFLTIDPATGRGLYADESRFLGAFRSVQDAFGSLGDILRYCSIR